METGSVVGADHCHNDRDDPSRTAVDAKMKNPKTAGRRERTVIVVCHVAVRPPAIVYNNTLLLFACVRYRGRIRGRHTGAFGC
jgi:hypothetical protein